MGALLTARFVRRSSSLEDLNRTLETRVADRERELAANYTRLAALQREHAASEERQLIMRDLHDGLGSQLFTSLSRVERGDMDDAQIAVGAARLHRRHAARARRAGLRRARPRRRARQLHVPLGGAAASRPACGRAGHIDLPDDDA